MNRHIFYVIYKVLNWGNAFPASYLEFAQAT